VTEAADGFSFWVKGTGSGQKIEYEVKSGGTDGEHAELFQGFFTDDVKGWKQVQIGFANLKKRSDYQPSGAPNNAVPNLTTMWGYAVNLPGGSTNTLEFDQVQVYQSLHILQDFEGTSRCATTDGASRTPAPSRATRTARDTGHRAAQLARRDEQPCCGFLGLTPLRRHQLHDLAPPRCRRTEPFAGASSSGS
jgi:hypothetical protein